MNITFILNDFSLHNHIVETYCTQHSNHHISLVKVPLVLRGKSRKETASRILPRLSRRFIWNKLQESIVVSLITLAPKLLGRGAVFRRLRRIAKIHCLPFHISQDVMSKETLAFVKQQTPDVIVTLFHQIIRSELIKIPRLGVVNIHPGILPEFRGIQPYFWELMEGFGHGGPSLHFIEDESIDTGRIIAQARFPTTASMSVQLNYYLTCRSAAALLVQVLPLIEENQLVYQEQKADHGNYYRWPDSDAVTELYKKGHQIVRWRDLFGILVGRYDEFAALDIDMRRS